MITQERCPTCGEPIPDDSPAGACPGCLFLLAEDSEFDEPVEHAPLRRPSLDKLQELFPQYRLEALAGVGGQAFVYRAQDLDHDRPLALKILRLERSTNPEFVSRFEREAHTLSKLAHPGIVQVYASGQTGDYCYIAMQWIAGTTLRQQLRERKLEPAAAIEAVSQICAAVENAHQAGVVHRDLKPENILLDETGQVRIADFGIAKLLGDQQAADPGLTATHMRMGTLRYMAPEQMESAATVDGRADVYAIGVMLFEMLTGQLPLPFGPAPSRLAGVAPAYDRIVARCLEPRPSQRFQSPREIAQALAAAGSVWKRNQHRFGWAAAIIVALAVAAFALERATPPDVSPSPVVPPPPGVATLLASEAWEWTAPENLGPVVNTPGNDHSPFLSSDGLTLLYHSRGHQQAEHVDIWQCRRPTLDAAWGPPENLGPPINSPHWEGDPCLSDDQLTLIFAADWRDSLGLVALCQSTRASQDSPWSKPRFMGLGQKYDSDRDRGPALDRANQMLYFTRGSETDRTFQLMRGPLPTDHKPNASAVPVGAPLDSLLMESDPAISADSLVLLWSVPFSPIPYDQEIWWSYRATPDAPWQTPRKLSDWISLRGAAEPTLSQDGTELYFSSARTTDLTGQPLETQGGVDLYVSRRVPKKKTDSPATVAETSPPAPTKRGNDQ